VESDQNDNAGNRFEFLHLWSWVEMRSLNGPAYCFHAHLLFEAQSSSLDAFRYHGRRHLILSGELL
jgi:hypothetical protein